ncbi:prepilin-type N-terminal cleavage/methylation domain-containing protein [Patescibacteria group bacterium]|nr:prepilin-type N-terminal cleavage/methylation domain-containing protein [Patescibacteria group bacterium]
MARNQLNAAHVLKLPRPTVRHQRTARCVNGFTLIELLVAIGLSVMLVAAASGLFFTTLRSDSKKTSVSELKDNGDYALSQMEFLLRNAVTLEPLNPGDVICGTGMNQIVFRSIDEGVTRLYLSNGQIASESVQSGITRYLTGGPTTATNLTFNCSQAAINSGSFVQINFTLTYATTSGNLFNDTGSENFTTTVNVRSF